MPKNVDEILLLRISYSLHACFRASIFIIKEKCQKKNRRSEMRNCDILLKLHMKIECQQLHSAQHLFRIKDGMACKWLDPFSFADTIFFARSYSCESFLNDMSFNIINLIKEKKVFSFFLFCQSITWNKTFAISCQSFLTCVVDVNRFPLTFDMIRIEKISCQNVCSVTLFNNNLLWPSSNIVFNITTNLTIIQLRKCVGVDQIFF